MESETRKGNFYTEKRLNAMVKIYAIFRSGTLQHLQDDDVAVEKQNDYGGKEAR
jgi:hypothetical protein